MDKEKIDKIYRENAQAVYKYLRGLTGDGGLAEEPTPDHSIGRYNTFQ